MNVSWVSTKSKRLKMINFINLFVNNNKKKSKYTCIEVTVWINQADICLIKSDTGNLSEKLKMT